jgi:plasmid maintenance system antidote protein VapI
MENLANDLQIHYHSLVRLYQPGRSISAQLAVRLEKTVGKEVIPRTLVRPDLFE